MPLPILLADDDQDICLLIKDYLEISGYYVLVANNGLVALELLDSYLPHLVISDIKMPQVDGYQLIKQIRQKPQFRLLPVIFLTEFNSTKERIKGYQNGCDVYLPKPFDIEELGAVVKNLLERSMFFQANKHYAAAKNEELTIEYTSLALSNREQEVLKLISKGLSNIEIGQRLFLSPKTVEKYVSSLLRKAESNNRAELVRFALEHHLIR
ncbi:MAG: response regulator transcription factor [Cyanobacteriota bacterium ELA615]|jgi:DNA-binding NarL/FixJ family response regulator